MYRVTVEEKIREHYPAGSQGVDVATEERMKWVPKAVVEADNKAVVAGTLRALADQLDPPKPAIRSGNVF